MLRDRHGNENEYIETTRAVIPTVKLVFVIDMDDPLRAIWTWQV